MHASLSLTLLLPALVLAGQDHASQDQVAPPSNEKLAELHATACASCHQPPDTRFAVDRAWITQLADTAWLTEEKRVRAALAKWFESKPLALPRVIDAPATAPSDGHGLITTDLGEGALMLVDGDGKHLRLSWEGEQRGAREVPAGEYHLTGYRILKTDADGVDWHLAATKPWLRKLEVIEGETCEVEIDARVHLSTQLTPRRVGVGVLGDGQAGLSIYRDGRRIPLAFRVLGAEGAELAKGDLRYG